MGKVPTVPFDLPVVLACYLSTSLAHLELLPLPSIYYISFLSHPQRAHTYLSLGGFPFPTRIINLDFYIEPLASN